jgi:imidazoleglycerol-phosphate dehydratase
MKRVSDIKRKTKETSIEIGLDLDGVGNAQISTPFHFFNHVLESFTKHAGIDLKVIAQGDIEVGCHHLVEDIGICIGKALHVCLGDKKSIERFGFAIIPMDETEITVSLDVSGRAYLRYDVDLAYEMIEGFETIIIEDFFHALVNNSFITLHIRKNVGLNSHHIIETVFKACGIALKKAVALNESKTIPSTKGVL